MKAQVVSFHCHVKSKTGQTISKSTNREVLTSIDNPPPILSGLNKHIQDLKKGEKRSISLTAEEAYGFYDPKKVIFFPKNKLPKHLILGQHVSIVGKSGTVRDYKVVHIHQDMVSLDGNHPLAGQDLVFEIETLDARDATDAEIAESATVAAVQQLLH